MFPDRLAGGYRPFIEGRLPASAAVRGAGGGRPQPEIMIVGCVNSRVSPEVIFDAAPGELLVVRNVANLVPPYQPDRIAARHQCGTGIRCSGAGGKAYRGARACPLRRHSSLCGGPGAPISRRLHRPVDVPDQPRRRAASARIRNTTRELSQAAGIRLGRIQPQQSDDISLGSHLVEQGKLELHGAYFGVAAGRLLIRDPVSGRFEPLADAEPDSNRFALYWFPLVLSGSASGSGSKRPVRDRGSAADRWRRRNRRRAAEAFPARPGCERMGMSSGS